MEKPMPFQSLQFQNLQKIGEGTFGEVYTTGENVIKIIPIEGEILVNGERQKSFKEIKKEILITKELSELRERIFNRCETFVKSLGFKIVCGKYPIELLREWDRFETSKGSENDRPDFLPDDQLFIIFEFENSGVALESVEIESVAQGVSIVKQVCCALAVAEKALQFEHRDLHWGNVLVRASVEDTIIFRLDGRDVSVRSQGVEVKIIDFTLSRITKDNKTIYIDLKNDVSLFAGQGDSQFDIYREMKKKNKNDWAAFSPFSNILWAHYICQKIFEAKLQAGLDEIRDFYKKVLSYKSCYRLM
ncbi:serine/threonine-protein kinase haspin-like [Mercenaria mercenaria]|uniref:serine/threonine-protein kinase haspin-like n=1 Tax=Mercenaria mercenaria TaxID=6596 RepID=UPI00234F9932|nr:serine/threonine-protein kinase haspin-like [Mercenaria mercenaria]